jgi:hypothetical protein
MFSNKMIRYDAQCPDNPTMCVCHFEDVMTGKQYGHRFKIENVTYHLRKMIEELGNKGLDKDGLEVLFEIAELFCDVANLSGNDRYALEE